MKFILSVFLLLGSFSSFAQCMGQYCRGDIVREIHNYQKVKILGFAPRGDYPVLVEYLEDGIYKAGEKDAYRFESLISKGKCIGQFCRGDIVQEIHNYQKVKILGFALRGDYPVLVEYLEDGKYKVGEKDAYRFESLIKKITSH